MRPTKGKLPPSSKAPKAAQAGGAMIYPIRSAPDEPAPFIIDWQPALEAALADLGAGADPGEVSEALHTGLAHTIAEVARRIGERCVVLSGGCFQNARLTEATVASLRAAGCEPI
jgi:hydrogenase maturation protein HypF